MYRMPNKQDTYYFMVEKNGNNSYTGKNGHNLWTFQCLNALDRREYALLVSTIAT